MNLVLIAILPMVVLVEPIDPSAVLPCKYSVRDVAFVNVHGKSWQLDLVKPVNYSEAEFVRWNKTLKDKLRSSNVGFAWHEADSQLARRLELPSASPVGPRIYLTDNQGLVLPIEFGDEDFETCIDRIIHSPARERLLDHVTDSLCIFLLVRGASEAENANAKETLMAAVKQIEKQMWMMEKPSDKGPQVIEIEASDPAEMVTMRSIGIDPQVARSLPAIAIIFGQARRLGEVLLSDQFETKNLVSLASICGSDCECQLDREWLYGQQMVHDWTIDRERAAEASLDFDPKSAFAIAEVAQILQKNSRETVGSSHVNLGAGLVIHDLDQLENETKVTEDFATDDQISEPLDSNDYSDAESLGSNSDSISTSQDASPHVPWFLFVGLAVGAIFIALFRMFKLRP